MGSLLGLLILTRAMTLPLLLWGVAILITERRLAAALALTAGTFACVVPFLVRGPLPGAAWWPTRSGLNLYIGNSPYTAALLPDHDVDILQDQAWALVERELSDLSEGSVAFNRAADALLASAPFSTCAENPGSALTQKALNVWYFFSPRVVPLHVSTAETRAVIDAAGRVVVENERRRPTMEVISHWIFFAPVLVLAAAGMYCRGRDCRRDTLLWSILGTFVIVHSVYFPATRYRAPVEFVLLFYAAVAIHFGYQAWRRSA